MYIGIYLIVKEIDKYLSVIAFGFSISAVIICFSTNEIAPIISFANQYFSANIQDQNGILVSGNTLWKINEINLSYNYGVYLPFFLITISGFLFAILMLKTYYFPRVTSIIGILGTSISLCYYITSEISSSLNVFPIVVSAPFLMIWYILIGIQILRSSRKRPRRPGSGDTAR